VDNTTLNFAPYDVKEPNEFKMWFWTLEDGDEP
jgi:hypothetical protein